MCSSYCTYENRKVVRVQSVQGKPSTNLKDRRPNSVFLFHKDSRLMNGRFADEEEDDESIVKGQSPMRNHSNLSMHKKRRSDASPGIGTLTGGFGSVNNPNQSFHI